MRYQLAYRASDKNLLVQAYGASIPGGYTNIGNFYHDGGGVDPVDQVSTNHVLYHDIQDVMYRRGELSMQDVKINFTRLTGIVASAADVAMNLTTDTTEQITVAYTPTDASNTDVTYASSDPAKVTVSATGLITAVALGTATITVTSKDGGFKSTIAVTVS